MTQHAASSLRGLTLAIMVLLVLEFLLGMWVNLFTISWPHYAGSPPSGAVGALRSLWWVVARGPWALRLHIAGGILLGVAAAAHTRAACGRPPLGSRWWSLVGLVGVLGAAGSGAAFLGDRLPGPSMLMSLGFAVALVGYGMAMTPARRGETPRRE